MLPIFQQEIESYIANNAKNLKGKHAGFYRKKDSLETNALIGDTFENAYGLVLKALGGSKGYRETNEKAFWHFLP